MHLQLHDDDDDRITSLEYLKPALDRSAESLQVINRYLAGGRTDKLFGGAKFDKQIKSSLKSLDDASKLFNMAVLCDHARTHHPAALLKRVKTFQGSAFSIGLSANAVDCIFCMELFRHVPSSEGRLALLREFHRVSRWKTLIPGRF